MPLGRIVTEPTSGTQFVILWERVLGDGEICNDDGDVDVGAGFICGGVQFTNLGIQLTKFK